MRSCSNYEMSLPALQIVDCVEGAKGSTQPLKGTVLFESEVETVRY